MCLLTFYLNPDASENELYLVLVNVRDEVYNRPTRLADFWETDKPVVGGMDMEPGKEGGTWLALSGKGKVGALLNILQPDEEILPGKKGRGFLAADFVIGDKDCTTYLNDISKEGDSYNEFLLVAIEFSSLKAPKIGCYTNYSSSPPVYLEPGIHSFGNSIDRERPWPKATKIKEKFTKVIEKYQSNPDADQLARELFDLLEDPTRYSVDDNMKRQGKGKSQEFLEKLSAILVHIPEANYGSRCHTVIVIDGKGHVDYIEKSRVEHLDDKWQLNHLDFNLDI